VNEELIEEMLGTDDVAKLIDESVVQHGSVELSLDLGEISTVLARLVCADEKRPFEVFVRAIVQPLFDELLLGFAPTILFGIVIHSVDFVCIDPCQTESNLPMDAKSQIDSHLYRIAIDHCSG
jgi:hypothetical protein